MLAKVVYDMWDFNSTEKEDNLSYPPFAIESISYLLGVFTFFLKFLELFCRNLTDWARFWSFFANVDIATNFTYIFLHDFNLSFYLNYLKVSNCI